MKPLKLLIADDHQLVMDGIKSLLKPETGFEIAGTAVDGYEVLRLIDKKDFDICLLDISMPGLDGVAVAKAIREKKPGIKIIILTTYNDKEIITALLHLGVAGYILKNASKQELIEAIFKVAAGDMYFSREVHTAIMTDYVRHLDRAKGSDDNAEILTEREKEVLLLLSREMTNEKIAAMLNISYRTVETHRKNIMQKTKSHNLAGLLKFAYTQGLLR